MKRNILLIFLAAVMAVSFTACGRRDRNEGTVTSSPSPTATAMPTASPEAMPSPSPEASAKPEEELSEALTLQDFRDAVKKIYGEGYIPSRELTEAEVQELTGLTEDMYVDIYAEAADDDLSPDIFIAVEAKDGMAEEVKEKLEVYKTQTGDRFTDDVFTDKLEAARVYQNGNYVFMMLLGEDTTMMGENTEGDTVMDDVGDAAETIGDRLKKSAEDAIKAIEDLIGMR